VINRWIVAAARLLAAAIFLATWAYGVTTYSPFAFDMFIRPQLLPQLAAFVTWHHAWYWAAYLLAALSLVPELAGRHGAATRWASLAFVLVFGGVGLHLLSTPVLATLTSGSRSSFIVPGALLPIAFLAVIDHLAAGVAPWRERGDVSSPPTHVLTATICTAAMLWLAHQTSAMATLGVIDGPWLMTAAWAFVLDMTLAIAAYTILTLVGAVAALSRRPFITEYALSVALIAIGIAEAGRRIILPAFAFSAADAAAIASAFGVTIAMMWSGLRVRVSPAQTDTPLRFLLSPVPTRAVGMVALVVVLVAARLATAAIVQVDWASILQTTIALVEATLIFGIFLEVLPPVAHREPSAWRLMLAPVAAIAALSALPLLSASLSRATNNPLLDAAAVLDRLPSNDPLAHFAATQWIEQEGFDLQFYQDVMATERRQSTVDPQPRHPLLPFAGSTTAPPPHILFIVVDSLRRDYLSPYNPKVTFTPNLEQWSRESFVFRNAFTPYGGTWLAMPSIWTGTAVTRGWAKIFPRINALEQLITRADYDFIINDFTVETNLEAPRTFLERQIPSLDTDLCRNLDALRAHTQQRPATARPLFVYLAPMNMHILNTQGGARGPRYEGFYEPYAARVERIDRCLGQFIAHYKEQGLYDNSIVVLTSDHGDLLGEDGRWGHQFHLFPEAIRIPMIVRLPERLRTMVTTDLSRISFLSDLAPTLYALLGAAPPGQPLAGLPLFVPVDQAPADRRRQEFMVMSSYGSTYGLLRRNGKALYIADLLNWREHAYELFTEPNGVRVPVTGSIRRVNQQGIRDGLDKVDRMFSR
jgi:hypothetical protein